MKLYRQIILLTLTLLVLVSSTGMAVGLHYCGGEVADVTFFGNKAACPMEQEQQASLPPCHTPQKHHLAKKSCCENHKLELKRLDTATDGKAITFTKTFDLKFIAVVKAVILHFYAPAAATTPAFALYTSPPLSRDIHVLVQSFLL
ncbi:HYC_CC_PP family protein [Pontibacter chitinilyticus]|uniref:HYC_CC_PP family protein n=1 Tax=Pontibacter chitinilyticus TaxID=2674989 RepID=UPI00321AF2D8